MQLPGAYWGLCKTSACPWECDPQQTSSITWVMAEKRLSEKRLEPSIPWLQEGPSESITFKRTLIFVKSSREKSPILSGVKQPLGSGNSSFCLTLISPFFLCSWQQRGKKAILLYAVALLKFMFSADASQVTLKLFLSRLNNPRSLALLCWSLNDYFAFALNSLHILSIPLNDGDQSQPSSVTVLVCAEQCSNYLMIQTCFSFATVLCLHFFQSAELQGCDNSSGQLATH